MTVSPIKRNSNLFTVVNIHLNGNLFKCLTLSDNLIFFLVQLFNSIPRIWKRSYSLICLWYFINFLVSAIIEWQFINPASYVLWNALFLYEALCIFIVLIFLWSHWLSSFKSYVQVGGH